MLTRSDAIFDSAVFVFLFSGLYPVRDVNRVVRSDAHFFIDRINLGVKKIDYRTSPDSCNSTNTSPE